MEQDTDVLEGSGARVQVVVRVRPVLPTESVNDAAVTCSQDGTKVQVLLPDKTGNGKELLPGTNRSGARSYEFDACLPGATTQSDLFEACGLQELVESALDGYSVTVFAFGQTGSGKTHTMIGPRLSRAGALATISQQGGDGGSLVEGADGVLPRALMAAYAGIEQRSDLAEFTVSASCLELYNESVTDLLGPDKNKQLAVRKDERGSFRVDGLTQMTCKTAGAALKAMARALQHRHTRAHALNDYSSRSHCLMTFVFASKERVPEAGGSQQQQGAAGGLRRYGKLVLVDLAGSERLRETGNTAREAVRETGAINKSLFTLGQVLASLAQRSSRGSDAFGAAPVHVPFRDSKLTQLLWDGLRGSGRALMLACLSPMKPHAEESLNTLHFAGMALRIKATPVVLLDPQDQLVLDLRNTIRQLQQENRQLASAMAQLSQGADASTVFDALPEKLRLVAARDGLGSAPGPGNAPPLAGSAAQRSPGVGKQRLAPPQTAPGQSAAASPSVDTPGGAPSDMPWPVMEDGSSRGTPGYPPPDVLQVTPSSPSAAALLPTPINYSYSFSSAPRISGASGSAGKKKQPGQGMGASAASVSSSYQTGSAARRSASVDTSAHRLKAGGAGAKFGSPAGLTRASSGSTFNDGTTPQRSGPSNRAGLGARLPVPLPVPAPLPDVCAFPELAAMEAQFQAALGLSPAQGSSAAAAGGMAKEAGGPRAGGDESHQRDQDDSGAAPSSRGGSAGAEAAAAPPPPPPPEPKALSWAERNAWFGQDEEMTAYAYEVHDELVLRQGFDAASDAYYDAIDARVSEQFPEKWKEWHAPAAAAPEGPSPQRRAPAPLPPAHNFGAGLKVALKDPTPAGLGLSSPAAGPDGLFSPMRGFGNVNGSPSRYVKPPNAAASPARAAPRPPQPVVASPKVFGTRNGLHSGGSGASGPSSSPSPLPGINTSSLDSQQQPAGRFQQPPSPGSSRVSGGLQSPQRRNARSKPGAAPGSVRSSAGTDVAVGGASVAAGSGMAVARRLPSGVGSTASSSPQEASTPTSVNPFGLNSSSAAPPITRNGGTAAPAAGLGSGWTLSQYGGPGAGRSMLARMDAVGAGAADAGWRDTQAEYVRQRQAVLSELRRTKEDAEEERRRILLKIGRTLGSSRWKR